MEGLGTIGQIPSFRYIFEYLRHRAEKDAFAKGVWASAIPKVSFMLWRLRWEKLPIFDRLMRHGEQLHDIKCLLCGEFEESIHHIFILCPMTNRIMSRALSALGSLISYNSNTYLQKLAEGEKRAESIVLKTALSKADIGFKPDRFKRKLMTTGEVNVLHHWDASMAAIGGDASR